MFRFARESLVSAGREDVAERLAPYRAGYTAEERRRIEGDLVSGRLLGVVATEALELGVDVGLLDCALAIGFPGTVASLRQQWGRAGRRGEGLALLVPGADALDRYFINHPDALLGRANEAAILDPTNPEIRIGHLRAAAHELPLTEARRRRARRRRAERRRAAGRGRGAAAHARRPRLARRRLARRARSRCAPARRTRSRSSSGAPARCSACSSRSARSRRCTRARSTCTAARRISPRRSTWRDRVALVTPFDGPWYTQPRRETDTSIVRALAGPVRCCGVELSYGEVEVSDQVVAYERRSLPEGRRLDTVPLDLPARQFATRALWFVPPDELMEEVGGDLLGALHAAEHALISVLPLLAMCDRWDIGGLSTNLHPQTLRPTVFVYDGHAGGVGIAQRGHDRFAELVASAARVVGDCRCRDGCPSCVQSPKCGNLNEMLDKGAAARLLRAMAPRAARAYRRAGAAEQRAAARRAGVAAPAAGPSCSSACCGVARSRSRSAQSGQPARSRPARQRGSAGSAANAPANSARAR